MTKKHLSVWGRKINLEVVFDRYAGEDILSTQEKALDALLSSWAVVDGSLDDVKSYILEQRGDAVVDGRIDNVFKFVKPESLFVPRKQRKRTVAIMCDFRLDPEHGLAVVFEKEKLAKIGPQDIAL